MFLLWGRFQQDGKVSQRRNSTRCLMRRFLGLDQAKNGGILSVFFCRKKGWAFFLAPLRFRIRLPCVDWASRRKVIAVLVLFRRLVYIWPVSPLDRKAPRRACIRLGGAPPGLKGALLGLFGRT